MPTCPIFAGPVTYYIMALQQKYCHDTGAGKYKNMYRLLVLIDLCKEIFIFYVSLIRGY